MSLAHGKCEWCHKEFPIRLLRHYYNGVMCDDCIKRVKKIFGEKD